MSTTSWSFAGDDSGSIAQALHAVADICVTWAGVSFVTSPTRFGSVAFDVDPEPMDVPFVAPPATPLDLEPAPPTTTLTPLAPPVDKDVSSPAPLAPLSLCLAQADTHTIESEMAQNADFRHPNMLVAP
jgi:hypothetical protein